MNGLSPTLDPPKMSKWRAHTWGLAMVALAFAIPMIPLLGLAVTTSGMKGLGYILVCVFLAAGFFVHALVSTAVASLARSNKAIVAVHVGLPLFCAFGVALLYLKPHP